MLTIEELLPWLQAEIDELERYGPGDNPTQSALDVYRTRLAVYRRVQDQVMFPPHKPTMWELHQRAKRRDREARGLQ